MGNPSLLSGDQTMLQVDAEVIPDAARELEFTPASGGLAIEPQAVIRYIQKEQRRL
jgi:hypothetical protein